MYNKYTRKKNKLSNTRRSNTRRSNTRRSNTRRSNTRRSNTRRSNTKKGGNVIAAGSYGCVFIPPLQCSPTDPRVNDKYISKLMTEKYAKKEMVEIKNVKFIANKLSSKFPGIKKYFLVDDAFMCMPGKLSKTDLVNFSETCDVFSDKNITDENINDDKNIEKLRVLQIINGGKNLRDYLKTFKYLGESIEKIYTRIVEFNILMIDLLKNAIIPLNSMNYNHFDLKTDNILINTDIIPLSLKIIDWGLSSENMGNTIPNAIRHGMFAFNTPYSIILFDETTQSRIKTAIQHLRVLHRNTPRDFQKSRSAMIDLITKELVDYTLLNNPGHFDYIEKYTINANINSLVSCNKVIENYIRAVLNVYMDQTYTFDVLNFFNEIFSRNADIFGFLTVYIDFNTEITALSALPLQTHSKNTRSGKIAVEKYSKEKPFIDKFRKMQESVSKILYDYLIDSKYASQPIDVNELIGRLGELNTL